jgi:hypothetical protein
MLPAGPLNCPPPRQVDNDTGRNATRPHLPAFLAQSSFPSKLGRMFLGALKLTKTRANPAGSER